ncbi:MAG: phosphodiester glycosidase family protein [bacterium]|nr:phosphodiester glycosidase family protein [bacterium]
MKKTPIHILYYASRIGIVSLAIGMVGAFAIESLTMLRQAKDMYMSDTTSLEKKLTESREELEAMKKEDQFLRNEELDKEIKEIESTYDRAVDVYEDLLDLRDISKKTAPLEDEFGKALSLLSERKYSSAAAQLTLLSQKIEKERALVASSFTIPASVAQSNAPPGSGYSRQSVATEIGTFLVDIIAGDLGSTRVIVDTASSSDCRNDCPVLSLGEYAGRNGAYAGVNGSYFCPASYPTCSDKKNSFDTLLMNKNKTYFNSDNNVYSTVPAVIFLSGSVRFVGRSLDWGRDTSPDGVLANQPLLLSGGSIAFIGDGDPKKGSKGSRSFVANKGSTVFIGVTHNATVAEVSYVLKALGMENGLNLDSGGSTALWSNGYKVGPGRGIPNAILFVRK